MAKLTAWLVTLIGVLLLVGLMVPMIASWNTWLVPLLVLIIGVAKLMRNYKKK